MRGRMAVVLVSLAALFVISTVVTFGLIREHGRYGQAINLAGRERMLLMKMTLEASAIAHGDDTQRPVLEETEAEFDAALGNLRRGDPQGGIPAPASDVRTALDAIEGRWLIFREQIDAAVSAPRGTAAADEAFNTMNASNRALLLDIDSALRLYEDDLNGQVARTEDVVIGLAIIGLVVAVAGWWYVLAMVARPLSKLADGAARFGRGDLAHRVPVDGFEEVGIVAREFNAMAQKLEHVHAKLDQQAGELQRKSARLEETLSLERERARRDPLTGALNHGAIATALSSLVESMPPGGSFAVAMVDVDSMKTVNDAYGHQAGDAVLLGVSAKLLGNDAIVGRYGGDEFLSILPLADRAAAAHYRASMLADRVRAPLPSRGPGAVISVVISVGLAVYPEDGETAEDLIRCADGAMYSERRRIRGQREMLAAALVRDSEGELAA